MTGNSSEAQLIRIWSLAAVVNRTGLSRSTIYTFIRSGTFPEAMKFNGRDIGFFAEEVEAWMAARPQQPERQRNRRANAPTSASRGLKPSNSM